MLTAKQVKAAVETERHRCGACSYHTNKILHQENFVSTMQETERKLTNMVSRERLTKFTAELIAELSDLYEDARVHLIEDTHPTQEQLEQEAES